MSTTGSTSKATTPSLEQLSKTIQQLTNENNTLKTKLVEHNKDGLKMPPPATYDGTPGQLRAFLTQMRTYQRFHLGAIANVTDQVLLAGAYLRGDALSWFEPYQRAYHETNSSEWSGDVARMFKHYANFEEAIKGAFGDPDEEREAERRLLTLGQRGSAANYAAQFRQQASRLHWDDEPLIAQFYRGLKDEVKDELVKDDRPATLSEYIERAVRIDTRQYERRVEKRNKGWVSTPKPKSLVRKHHTTAYGQHGGPMELDAAERKGLPKSKEEQKCFNCGKKGHYARNCRNKKPWTKVPEPPKQVNHTNHASMTWAACYDDNCTTHKSDKEAAGWYPKNHRIRTIAVGERGAASEQLSHDSDTDSFTEAMWEQAHGHARERRTPSPEQELEEDSPDLPSGREDGMTTVEEPRLAPEGIITSINLWGRPRYEVLRDEISERPHWEDDPKLVPQGRHHERISWAACIYDQCMEHFNHKAYNDFFPIRVPGQVIPRPYTREELRHWILKQRYHYEDPPYATFCVDPCKPLPCLRKEITWEQCSEVDCSIHARNKVEGWHEWHHGGFQITPPLGLYDPKNPEHEGPKIGGVEIPRHESSWDHEQRIQYLEGYERRVRAATRAQRVHLGPSAQEWEQTNEMLGYDARTWSNDQERETGQRPTFGELWEEKRRRDRTTATNRHILRPSRAGKGLGRS